MAHWAQIDEHNDVIQVIVADDDKEQWLSENLGGTWVQTSYNTKNGVHVLGGTPFRGNYAGIGFKYHKNIDAFMPQKPMADIESGIIDWEIDTNTYSWIPVYEEQS